MKTLPLFILFSLLLQQNSRLMAQALKPDTMFRTGIGFDGPVLDIDVQQDGKIICVGDFQSSDGNQSPNIARLNPDGSFDGSFASPISAAVVGQPTPRLSKVRLQANGQMLVASVGIVAIDSSIIGVPLYANFARINPNGYLDFSFTKNAFDNTYGLLGIPPNLTDFVLQADGTIIVSISDIGITKLYNNGQINLNNCSIPFIQNISPARWMYNPQPVCT